MLPTAHHQANQMAMARATAGPGRPSLVAARVATPAAGTAGPPRPSPRSTRGTSCPASAGPAAHTGDAPGSRGRRSSPTSPSARRPARWDRASRRRPASSPPARRRAAGPGRRPAGAGPRPAGRPWIRYGTMAADGQHQDDRALGQEPQPERGVEQRAARPGRRAAAERRPAPRRRGAARPHRAPAW